MESIDIDVRHFIYQVFSNHAHPPTVNSIADYLNLPNHKVKESLDRLAGAHHIALAPGTHNIWMAHPFSGLRTDFVTKVGHKGFWGNGVWDMFGISAILNAEAELHIPCGCGNCKEKLELHVQPGMGFQSEWLVHFVVPAKAFWDKIGYTGATILPFSLKEHLEDWLSQKKLPTGYVMPIETCWALAQRWYTGRAQKDWQKLDAVATQELFISLGLTSEFWNLGLQE